MVELVCGTMIESLFSENDYVHWIVGMQRR